jgi:hypothetical protein
VSHEPDADDHHSAALVLPSTGPDPIALDSALAAVVGYAQARRPLRFRSPGRPEGRWVTVPAYGWARFDAATPETTSREDAAAESTATDRDVLLGETLHGRLDRDAWQDVHDGLLRAGPLAEQAAARADGRPFWDLPAEEFSVLDEPGTVGALLRETSAQAGPYASHVLAALHHRHPTLVPHLTRATRRALLPHLEEGDSGVEAVIRRELVANAAALTELEHRVEDATHVRATRLRLHDVLLWLATTLRWPHAVGAAP